MMNIELEELELELENLKDKMREIKHIRMVRGLSGR